MDEMAHQRYHEAIEKASVVPRTADAVYPPLHEDLLRAVREITQFWHGHVDMKALVGTFSAIEKGTFPSFVAGKTRYARRSTILAEIWRQETKNIGKRDALLLKTHIALTAALPLLMEMNVEQNLPVAIQEAQKSIEELLQS